MIDFLNRAKQATEHSKTYSYPTVASKACVKAVKKALLCNPLTTRGLKRVTGYGEASISLATRRLLADNFLTRTRSTVRKQYLFELKES